MKTCEGLLIFIIILLGIQVIISDLKRGLVENTTIIVAGVAGICINAVYYCMFMSDLFLLFVVNLIIISTISVLLYGRGYWAAGDSKLMICMTLLIPGRLYGQYGLRIPGATNFIIIFLVAYAFIIIESILSWVFNEKSFRQTSVNLPKVPSLIVSFVSSFCILSIISIVFQILFRNFYQENRIVFSMISIVIVTMVSENKYIRNKFVIVVLTLIVILILLAQGFRGKLWISGFVKSYLIVLMALIIRCFANGYNYKEIPTKDVCAGMILSYSTVFCFQGSSIKNLPHYTREDMRDRISESQAEAVKLWGKSKKGKPSITIVRKIPFALFIVLGNFLYIILRMVN